MKRVVKIELYGGNYEATGIILNYTAFLISLWTINIVITKDQPKYNQTQCI
jgi:hypothetical protein